MKCELISSSPQPASNLEAYHRHRFTKDSPPTRAGEQLKIKLLGAADQSKKAKWIVYISLDTFVRGRTKECGGIGLEH